ncbi:hypothetical protein Hanom_Chr14g01272491 [Helianthus anomalus]
MLTLQRGKVQGVITLVSLGTGGGGVEDVNVVLREMNTVKIFEAKLSVSLAKYDKNHKMFIHIVGAVGSKAWRPKDTNPNVGTSSTEEVRQGVSYFNALWLVRQDHKGKGER